MNSSITSIIQGIDICLESAKKKKKRLPVYDKYMFELKWVTKIGEVNY